jgi:asparaginyl-tRNA synthetase
VEKSRPKIKQLLTEQPIDTQVTIKGWVRTKRGNKNVAFVAVNDGSTIHNIQAVVDMSKFSEEELKPVTTGACVGISGKLVRSQGQGQSVEILAEKIEVFGTADPETYPLQKKGHTLEFLREIAHLRPRTNTFGAIFRIRHHLAYAIHQFFNDRGFFICILQL